MVCPLRRIAMVGALIVVSATASGCAQLAGGDGTRAGRPWALGFGDGSRDDISWDELMRSADRFRESGDIDRAVAGYLRALQRSPERPLARVRLAQLQLLRDQPQRAAAGFRGVLAVTPDDARAWAGLAVAALALGRLEEAREAFARAAQHAPDSALAHAGQALALDLLGRPEQARDQLAIAREGHPDDVWLLNNFGVSRLLAKDWQGAEAALRTALALEPGDTTARNNLGLALGRQERYVEAYAAFLEVGAERAARNNLGYVYFLNGHYAEAIGQYELALATEGGEAQVVLTNLNAALDALEAAPAGAGRGRELR